MRDVHGIVHVILIEEHMPRDMSGRRQQSPSPERVIPVFILRTTLLGESTPRVRSGEMVTSS